ncbi:transposase [Thermobrachium celere]|uniref:transposase n=1 Tax=Thermobrachium celere TaxID=53422 RepID=UPI0009FD273D
MKHLPLFLKPTILVIKKRRYRCNSCGKRFSELAIAHTLKEKLLKITETASSSAEARALLKEWIKLAQNSGLKEFQKCADNYIRYFDCH